MGRTPLHLAALRGQAETVALLCNHGALLNARDSDGVAPIHKAVVQSSTEVAEQLIACGADTNLTLPVIFSQSAPSRLSYNGTTSATWAFFCCLGIADILGFWTRTGHDKQTLVVCDFLFDDNAG